MHPFLQVRCPEVLGTGVQPVQVRCCEDMGGCWFSPSSLLSVGLL